MHKMLQYIFKHNQINASKTSSKSALSKSAGVTVTDTLPLNRSTASSGKTCEPHTKDKRDHNVLSDNMHHVQSCHKREQAIQYLIDHGPQRISQAPERAIDITVIADQLQFFQQHFRFKAAANSDSNKGAAACASQFCFTCQSTHTLQVMCHT
jgi:hypothetical protein